MKINQSDCTAALGTVSAAMSAQRVLGRAAIPSTVIKLSRSESGRGCGYGIAFSCLQAGNVRSLLESAGIAVRGWGER